MMTTVYARSDFESDLTATKVQSDRTMSLSMIDTQSWIVGACLFHLKKVCESQRLPDSKSPTWPALWTIGL